jgi:hypothetical protein
VKLKACNVLMEELDPVCLLPSPMYSRLKHKEYSWNNFFDCPMCKKYCFRVVLNAYETPFWDEIDIDAKCLGCGFAYNETKTLNGSFDDDEGFDPVDFIVDYFNLEVN